MPRVLSRAEVELAGRFAWHEEGFAYVPEYGFLEVNMTEDGLSFTPIQFTKQWYSDGWEHFHLCDCGYCRYT